MMHSIVLQSRRLAARARSLALVGVCLVVTTLTARAEQSVLASWPTAGGNVANTHAMNSPNGPIRITLDTVKDLKVKWFYATVGGVAVTPTVEPGGVYFATQHGALIKLDPTTGHLLWQQSLPGLARSGTGGASTTSPAIASDRVIVGFNGYVMAIAKSTGALIWRTLVDPHPLAKMHVSPVIMDGHVYAGMASTEEIASLTPGYVPSFRGSAFSLSLATGAIEWKTYTVPAGYTGGAIWGGSPVVDVTRGLVFFTNGDNYTVPARVGACIRSAGRDVPAQRACLDPTDYVDSFLALRMTTGKVVWTRPTIGADAWLPAGYCADPTVFVCPTVNHPYDVDFAQGPSLFYVHDFEGTPDDRGGHGTHWMLGAGQKTGTYWALNPNTGGLFWSTKTANVTGELKWGSAVDTARNMIYTALDNSSPTLGNDLVGRHNVPIPNSKGGVWSGLDSKTGKIIFQIPGYGHALDLPNLPGNTPGGLTVSNGLVFGGATSGYFAAFADTGLIRWTFNSGGVVAGSPAVVNDNVYWGTGNYKPAVANQTTGVYCFSIP